jgi:isoquinoline 1-oxidoreductase subunit beta
MVFDSGNVVNPSICVQQLQGCAVYEMSHALYGGIDIRNGRVENNNFDRYRILRIDECRRLTCTSHFPAGRPGAASVRRRMDR